MEQQKQQLQRHLILSSTAAFHVVQLVICCSLPAVCLRSLYRSSSFEICPLLCVFYRLKHNICTVLFKMIVGVLTTCHTQYTWDRNICLVLFNRTTLQVFVTYLAVALYMHPLWFYRHQHGNRVHFKLFVACQRWWFQWRFWFVPSVPGYLREEEEHKPDPWRNPVERNHMGLHLVNEVASC